MIIQLKRAYETLNAPTALAFWSIACGRAA
jgi:hypothetical protein